MIENTILKLFIENNEIYDKYHTSLKLDFIKQNYPTLNRLFGCLPVSSFDGLEASYLSKYPVFKEGDRQALRTQIDTIASVEVNADEIIPYLESHLARSWASDLGLLALEVADGKKPVEILDEIIAKRESSLTLDTLEEVEFVSDDITELVKDEQLDGGLTWSLKCLNQSLGPLRKGNFGQIFARVNVGKTAMWVSQIVHMVQQVEQPILIIFNEEQGRDVMFRIYSALTGLSYLEIMSNPEHALKLYRAKAGHKIRFIDQVAYNTKTQIEKLAESLQPSLIIIDNLDKVKGFSADRKDLLLHEIYKWARELAKNYCPLISIGQADNTGHNSKILDYSQMADSKTAKPSELDFILGIGSTDQEGYENVRFLTISKNKLRGSKDTIEAMRHAKGMQVLLRSELSRYEDL